jgi:hypothetical protein
MVPKKITNDEQRFRLASTVGIAAAFCDQKCSALQTKACVMPDYSRWVAGGLWGRGDRYSNAPLEIDASNAEHSGKPQKDPWHGPRWLWPWQR